MIVDEGRGDLGGAPEPADPEIRVFLVDDHELLRRGLRAALASQAGFRVVGESGSAREAARRIPALRPHVMLLDVQLPDGSGIEVCRQVRSVDPDILGLIVTTYDDDEARLAAALAGASGFVLKQIRSAELVSAVRQVARGQVLFDGSRVWTAFEGAAGGWPDPRLTRLTGQERRVLGLIADGLTNRQIGERLGVREKTVKNYVTSILFKLGLQRRTQAAVLVTRWDRSPPEGAQGGTWR
ncbi:MAG TPA: response regulator transcription factor [Kineosporiaceae bacterium]|nr:response regulator transcription factor [Kineosporiaceae bacterium]